MVHIANYIQLKLATGSRGLEPLATVLETVMFDQLHQPPTSYNLYNDCTYLIKVYRGQPIPYTNFYTISHGILLHAVYLRHFHLQCAI